MKKRIAPTVILIGMILLIAVLTTVLIYAFSNEGLGLIWKIIIALVPMGIIAALVSVYLERIKEINREENEDLNEP